MCKLQRFRRYTKDDKNDCVNAKQPISGTNNLVRAIKVISTYISAVSYHLVELHDTSIYTPQST